MVIKNIRRSKILADIRDGIRSLPDINSPDYNDVREQIRNKICENSSLLSSVIPDFRLLWHDVRLAIHMDSKEQVLHLNKLAQLLDDIIPAEIESENTMSFESASTKVREFSYTSLKLVDGLSDISQEDLYRISPEVSCILSEISAQLNELQRIIDTI